MAIIIKDNFDFLDDTLDKTPGSLIIKGDHLKEQINYIKQEEIKSIYLSYFLSTNIRDLSFLADIPFVEKVNINDMDISYNGIYNLNNLRELILSVKNRNQHLDLTKFPFLESLSIDWYSSFPDLTGNKSLKELSIWKFKPKTKCLKELSLPEKLEKLQITESNILNLEGLELKHLTEFEGHHCNSLESIKGIDSFNNNLKVLILDYCKKLSINEELQNCISLEKLIFRDCANIASFSWLKYLKNLNHLSFGSTKLIDGDISPCFGIDYVSFKDQKYYNHKLIELKK